MDVNCSGPAFHAMSETMGEVEWTNDSVIHLVQEYRKLPELWDRNHELHNVQTAKYEAWTALARHFGCDIADLRKKITSVLASYRREKGKVRSGARSTWFLYPHLKFLSGYIHSPSAPSRQPPQPMFTMDADDVDQEDDSPVETEVMIKQEPIAAPVTPPKKGFANLKHSRRLTRLKRLVSKESPPSSQTDSKLLEMLRLLKKSDISKKKDECDSFGEYIATSLRKHDDRTQSMIKQAINNILFEQEMKKYNSHYSMIISDVNPLSNADDNLDMSHENDKE